MRAKARPLLSGHVLVKKGGVSSTEYPYPAVSGK